MSTTGKMSRTTGASTSKQNGGATLYQCDVCGKDFPFKVVLDMHKKDHTFKNVYKCHICGVSYPKKSQLDMHYRKHTGERPFKCDECDSSFMNSSNLQRHKRKHVCKRRYDSAEWEAAYTLSDNLSAEKRAKNTTEEDNPENPYTCTECGEAFPKMNTLMVHKRKHSGERPYACEECGAMFAVRASLDYHKLKHSGGESSYWQNVCDICGDAFTSKDGLMQHQRKHTGARPFNYDRYFAAFSSPSDGASLESSLQIGAQQAPGQPIPGQDQQQLPTLQQQQVHPDQQQHHQLQHLPNQHHYSQHIHHQQQQQTEQQQDEQESSQLTLQLHELQPSPQLHQMSNQGGSHMQIPSALGGHHTSQGYAAQVGQEHQVVPGPLGPQAQPVQQTNGRMEDIQDVNIKEEPQE